MDRMLHRLRPPTRPSSRAGRRDNCRSGAGRPTTPRSIPERAKGIADDYEATAHAPQDSFVLEAHENLIRRKATHYREFEAASYRFLLLDPNNARYKSPWDGPREIRAVHGAFSHGLGDSGDDNVSTPVE